MKKVLLILSLIVVSSMLFTACAKTAAPEAAAPAAEEAAPAEEAAAPAEEAAAPVGKICQVTDTGGIDDKSFNALAWAGMEKAADDFGVEIKYLESQQASDYEVNINAFIEEGCDLIISVGYLLADATAAAATANPDQKFAIIDNGNMDLPNVRGNSTEIDQGTFLAGLSGRCYERDRQSRYLRRYPLPLNPSFHGMVMPWALRITTALRGTTVDVLGWDMA